MTEPREYGRVIKFEQSLINVSGTVTVEEIMHDMAQIAELKIAAIKTVLYVRASQSKPTVEHQMA